MEDYVVYFFQRKVRVASLASKSLKFVCFSFGKNETVEKAEDIIPREFQWS